MTDLFHPKKVLTLWAAHGYEHEIKVWSGGPLFNDICNHALVFV